MFNYPAWNTHCDRVRWYIAVHKAACTYRYIVTDGDTGKNRNTGTNPHIVPDGYRAGILKPFIASVLILSQYRKAVIKGNLERSFPDKTKKEINRIARRYYLFLGEVVVDTINLAGARLSI